jgi:F0F1-type ATP synthase membrane subunit c/vacuolar-type H+-ATPase subunit K
MQMTKFGAGVSVGSALVASAILQADSTTAGFPPTPNDYNPKERHQ